MAGVVIDEAVAEANYQQQLEEAVALRSIFGDDVRFSTSEEGSCLEVDIDPEDLLSMGSSTSGDGSSAKPVMMDALIHVELPAGGLQIALNSGGEEGGGLIHVGVPLPHLPPIQLSLSFPPSYPSNTPPGIASLSAMWLQPCQCKQLACALQSVWEEQGGEGFPITFLWMDYLKTSALRDLGISDTLVVKAPVAQAKAIQGAVDQQPVSTSDSLSPPPTPSSLPPPPPLSSPGAAEAVAAAAGAASREAACAEAASVLSGERRARGCCSGRRCSGGSSSDSGASCSQAVAAWSEAEHQIAQQVAMALLRYSSQMEYQHFQTEGWTCKICFEDVPGSRCVRLPECSHYFCRDCFTTQCRMNVKEGAVDKVTCPEPGCRLPVPPFILQRVLTPEEFERWETLLLQKALDRMEDVVYCPRCESICIAESDKTCQCPACLYVFCTICMCPYHPGERCMDEEARLEIVMQRRNAADPRLSALQRQRKEADLMNQMKSLQLISKTTKRCPSCEMGVEKNEGCNKMVCGYCQQAWCWKCLQVITNGYAHFGEGRCRLLDQDEIDRWNTMNARPNVDMDPGFRVRYMLGNQQQQQQLARPAYCPVCGQVNLKEERNNNVRCWSCNSNFCALCREWLRTKPGSHFGSKPGQCKQHT